MAHDAQPNDLTPAQQRIMSALTAQADRAREMVHRACQSLVDRDVPAAERIISDDAGVDAVAAEVHDDVSGLLVGTTPRLEDVRFAFASLHANLHLERIADYAVTIAKMTRLSAGMAGDRLVLEDLMQMGERAEAILMEAMVALRDQDAERARGLVELDQAVNQANRTTVVRLLDLGADAALREWGLRMLLVSRCLERIGDHAVDIGEQAAYMATGEPAEFSDASRGREILGG